ncbi:MAG: hypothetical protein R2749_22930 [Acidimicrobiales bacterium]
MSAPSIPTGPDGGGAPDETELRSAGVVELAAALAAGRTTSVALLECHLAATDRLDPLIGAYLRRFDDEASPPPSASTPSDEPATCAPSSTAYPSV